MIDRKKIIKRITLTIIIFILLISSCYTGANNVEASPPKTTTYYFTGNRGPRLKYTITNPEKFMVSVVDNNGIKLLKVEKYENNKLKNISSKVNISSDKTAFEVPKDLIGNSLKIKVTAIDNTNNHSINILTIFKKTNVNDNKYFTANLSPRFSFIAIPSVDEGRIDNLVLKVTDDNKVQSAILTDLNANNNIGMQIEQRENQIYLSCKLDSLKAVNLFYKVRVRIKDRTEHATEEQMEFRVTKGVKSTPTFIAHRGASKIAEGNTVKAFKKAAQNKANVFGVETDIRVSKDNKLVCVHDEAVNNKEVKEVDYNYLKEYNVATFNEYIDIVNNSNKCAVIELKNESNVTSDGIDIAGGKNTINRIMKKLKNINMTGRSIIMAFDYESLQYIRKTLKSNIPLCYLIGNPTQKHVDKAAELGNTLIGCNQKYIRQEIIDYAHKKGVKINVYTADEYIKQSILTNMGADIITTNVVDMK